jgi:LmbE family N-acetylglucosaminyl deacetylase
MPDTDEELGLGGHLAQLTRQGQRSFRASRSAACRLVCVPA